MTRFFTKQNIIKLLIILLLIVACYYILPVSVPLLVAFFTSLLLAPLVKMLQNKFSFSQKLSVMTVFIVFIAFIGFSSYVITTKVVTEVAQIVQNAPEYMNEINAAWNKIEKDMVDASEHLPKAVTDAISSQVQTTLDYISSEIGNFITIENVTNFVKEIPNYLVSFLVFLIALFLFLIDLPKITVGLYSMLKEKTAEKVHFMSSRLSSVVFGFLKAQFLVSIIIFVVSLAGLLLIKPEVAVFMSLVIWVIDFIPIIGSIVILAPWSIFDLITGDTSSAAQLAILAAILLIIRRTVEPKVMGAHIGLSPLATLIAMYLGLKILGLLGFIIGPLILIAFTAAREADLIKINFKI
ncbi:sporulation integral membrane protein YtvI [Bacillus massiliigorillae]|uniref:sporulation integral membrane protein YtvI n=1 Tax=Bacillus massiliigorillae TaxID=1243664 RepID=UPI0003A580AA|nr:sporulation integral membrane protein YtvI [Bacillus massiliigorillae]